MPRRLACLRVVGREAWLRLAGWQLERTQLCCTGRAWAVVQRPPQVDQGCISFNPGLPHMFCIRLCYTLSPCISVWDSVCYSACLSCAGCQAAWVRGRRWHSAPLRPPSSCSIGRDRMLLTDMSRISSLLSRNQAWLTQPVAKLTGASWWPAAFIVPRNPLDRSCVGRSFATMSAEGGEGHRVIRCAPCQAGQGGARNRRTACADR
jgi:hypothetical protein